MLTIKTIYYVLTFYTLKMPLKAIIPVLMVCGFLEQYFLSGRRLGRHRSLITHVTLIVFAEVASYIITLAGLGTQYNYVILSIILLNVCLLIGCIVADIVLQKLGKE